MFYCEELDSDTDLRDYAHSKKSNRTGWNILFFLFHITSIIHVRGDEA